jgi:zinc protease
MNQGHTTQEGEKDVDAVLDQMKTKPVTSEQLQKAKNQEISGFILSRETDQSKADALGRYAVIGKNPNLMNTDLGNYLKVSAADIERVAQQYFTLARSTVMIIEPPKAGAVGQTNPEQRP